MNTPKCENLVNLHSYMCKTKNLAVVHPMNQFYSRFLNCPIYELSNFLPDEYGSIMTRKGFKHKEKINQAYLKMREVGIVDRMSKRYGMKKDPLKNFQDHYSDKYNVVDEGVMFDHVKFIVIGYFMFLPIPLLVLLIEILIHKYKHRFLNN